MSSQRILRGYNTLLLLGSMLTLSFTSGYPLITLVLLHWGSAGTFAWLLTGTVAAVVSGCGWVLAFSFQLSAFSRDGGLPLASYLIYVHPRTNTPIYASSVIYSLAVMVTLITIALPIGLRPVAGDRWIPGPWNLGAFSKPVHLWALLVQLYLIVMESFQLTQSGPPKHPTITGW